MGRGELLKSSFGNCILETVIGRKQSGHIVEDGECPVPYSDTQRTTMRAWRESLAGQCVYRQ